MRANGMIPVKKVYSIDENFFRSIDSEEKAYSLGWWYSDGNVSKNKFIIRIEVQDRDVEILKLIKGFMKYEGPLLYYPQRKFRDNSCPTFMLSIGRKILAEQLISLGCIPNKSKVIKFPTEKQVPATLLRHFVRGEFEGDGTIDSRGICSISSGSIDFITGLQKVIPCNKSEVQSYTKILETGKPSTNFKLCMNYKKDAESFLRWIYNDTKLCLSRKRKRYGVLYLDESLDINY